MDQIQPSKPVKSFDQIWIKEFSTKKKLDQNRTLVGNNKHKQNCNYIACGSQIIKRPNAADPNEHDILYTHTHTHANTRMQPVAAYDITFRVLDRNNPSRKRDKN